MQPLRQLQGQLPCVLISLILASCTTVNIMEAGVVKTEHYLGLPVISVTAGDKELAAVRVYGTGIMVSNSQLLIGYTDSFTVKLPADSERCSMVILITEPSEAESLLNELKLNRDIYSNICATPLTLIPGEPHD